MNRHYTTTETQAAIVRIEPNKIPVADIKLAQELISMPARDYTKWFDAATVVDYQAAFQSQDIALRNLINAEPHTRRCVMEGPTGGCWLATQILSLRPGGFHVIAFYRSLDRAHFLTDAALQLVIGNHLTNHKVEEITFLVGSYHRYLP